MCLTKGTQGSKNSLAIQASRTSLFRGISPMVIVRLYYDGNLNLKGRVVKKLCYILRR
jgi:hypothetical protein